MFLAFKLQWCIITVFVLAGGVESLDNIDNNPEYLAEKLRWSGNDIDITELLEEQKGM